ncbi:MAG: GTP cyclohydrolase I FolE [Candidatus Schekmanbacteria bacterium RBG_16_38_10]|uniref:GTP cyclohydrolase 1 n=1 Tax=Candidatus Schekmanbacteria bacterium RBG_16_38_10 TaxID=1817879 RepID=A0A1F7RPL9_9BACT|nr:MAG: GTP cyclohydrolase I FolE [Candidatus Schekmanbacteria bacterium RBG_16_38_10]
MEELIRKILAGIGENPNRQGLKKTPSRVQKTLKFLTKGYGEDPKKIFEGAIFREDYEEMILLKGIDIYSLCEHHLLPFFGKCHVAYIPKKKLIGLSKIAKLVEVYSRRLQVQERLTNQIAKTLEEELDPLGVAVVIEAQHLCMIMRGVEKQNSVAVTSSMLGGFRRPETRAEFMNLIK